MITNNQISILQAPPLWANAYIILGAKIINISKTSKLFPKKYAPYS
jgi:hypothetical protein